MEWVAKRNTETSPSEVHCSLDVACVVPTMHRAGVTALSAAGEFIAVAEALHSLTVYRLSRNAEGNCVLTIAWTHIADEIRLTNALSIAVRGVEDDLPTEGLSSSRVGYRTSLAITCVDADQGDALHRFELVTAPGQGALESLEEQPQPAACASNELLELHRTSHLRFHQPITSVHHVPRSKAKMLRSQAQLWTSTGFRFRTTQESVEGYAEDLVLVCDVAGGVACVPMWLEEG